MPRLVRSATACVNSDSLHNITGDEATLPAPPDLEPQQKMISAFIPSVAEGLAPIHRQCNSLVQSSPEESGTVFVNPLGQAADSCESLLSSVTTPSSVSSRSSSRTSSTSSMDSILPSGYWFVDPHITDRVADPMSSLMLHNDRSNPSDSQTLSSSLLEALRIPDDLFDFTDSTALSCQSIPEGSMLDLMALSEPGGLASTGLQRWDPIDLSLASSAVGYRNTASVADAPETLICPTYPLACHEERLEMVLDHETGMSDIGSLGGIIGNVAPMPSVADAPWFVPPPLMTTPSPMFPQPLMHIHEGAFQHWTSQQDQAAQGPLDPGSFSKDMSCSRPMESCSRYLHPCQGGPPQLNIPQQPIQYNGVDLNQQQHYLDLRQQQQPHFGFFPSKVESRQDGYVRQEIGYVRQAISPPPVTSLKRRRRLTTEESDFLLQQFGMNERPTAQEREGFAKHLNLDRRTIQVWFQNRRAKLKRDGRIEDESKTAQGQGEEECEGEEEEEDCEEDCEEKEDVNRDQLAFGSVGQGVGTGGNEQPGLVGLGSVLAGPFGAWEWEDLGRMASFLDASPSQLFPHQV